MLTDARTRDCLIQTPTDRASHSLGHSQRESFGLEEQGNRPLVGMIHIHIPIESRFVLGNQFSVSSKRVLSTETFRKSVARGMLMKNTSLVGLELEAGGLHLRKLLEEFWCGTFLQNCQNLGTPGALKILHLCSASC